MSSRPQGIWHKLLRGCINKSGRNLWVLNPPQPAVVVITDSSLKLATPLTGFGILVVPNDFEINAALNWTGIVVVSSALSMSAGQFLYQC